MNHIRDSFKQNPWWTIFAYSYVLYRAVTYVLAKVHVSQKIGYFPWYITDYFNYYSRIFIFVFVLLPRSLEWQKQMIHYLVRYFFLPFANTSFVIFCCSPFIRVIGGPGWKEKLLIKIDSAQYADGFWLLDVSMHIIPFLFFCSLLYSKRGEIVKALQGLSKTAINLQLLTPLPFMALWCIFYDFFDIYILEKSLSNAISIGSVVVAVTITGSSLIKELLFSPKQFLTLPKKVFLAILSVASIVSGICAWGPLYPLLSPLSWAITLVGFGVFTPKDCAKARGAVLLFASSLIGVTLILRTTLNSQLFIPLTSNVEWFYYLQEFFYSMGMVTCVLGFVVIFFKNRY